MGVGTGDTGGGARAPPPNNFAKKKIQWSRCTLNKEMGTSNVQFS